jgi:hypothetical protein
MTTRKHALASNPWINGVIAMFPCYYKPLLDDGTIPSLDSNPKLYFATAHINNGEWVQFHGPGTTIFDVGRGLGGGNGNGSDFELTAGGLFPKGKHGSFTTQRHTTGTISGTQAPVPHSTKSRSSGKSKSCNMSVIAVADF